MEWLPSGMIIIIIIHLSLFEQGITFQYFNSAMISILATIQTTGLRPP